MEYNTVVSPKGASALISKDCPDCFGVGYDARINRDCETCAGAGVITLRRRIPKIMHRGELIDI